MPSSKHILSFRNQARLVSVCLTAFLSASLVIAQAESLPLFDSYPTSEPLLGDAGDLIHIEPSFAAIIPGTGVNIDAEVVKVLYQSNTALGTPVAVTGTILTPTRPWPGPGKRPLISFAPGTQGNGDQCAPSSLMKYAQEWEYSQILPLLTVGYSVAVTDYEGLGLPGDHPYLNREAAGHNVLDLARAALKLVDTNDREQTPIGLWGYSEGGHASASAAELAASYAPELNIVGSYVGAPPSSLADLAISGDGSILSSGIGWVINGFIAAYPELEDQFLAIFNEAGLTVIEKSKTMCIYDAPFLNSLGLSSSYTKDGRLISTHLSEAPWKSVVMKQQLGTVGPDKPTFVAVNAGDDITLASGVDNMVRNWCSLGSEVIYHRYPLPSILPKTAIGHVLGLPTGLAEALLWFNNRFAGEKVSSTC
ncbi:MAG: lipase family protein [Mycobacteriaceae bacterium]